MIYTYIKWHGFFALSSEKNVSLSVCDVPKISKRQERKWRGAKCGTDRGAEGGDAASTLAFLVQCALEPANGC